MVPLPDGELTRAKFFAFCGIGNPAAFFDDLLRWGFHVIGRRAFRDHHRYSPAETERLERDALVAGADAMICTEKDVFNLRDALPSTPAGVCVPHWTCALRSGGLLASGAGRCAATPTAEGRCMKILVRANNWVGDAVMAIPALEAIRGRWPEAEIVVLARPWVADLYRGQGYVDRLIVYDRDGRHRGFWGRERLAAELRREKFDVAMLFQNAFDAAWIVWRAGMPERIGYARDARGWLLTRAIPVPRKGEIPAHESYYYLELLRRAGWLAELPATGIERISLRISQDARRAAEQTLLAAGARAGATRVALAPGAAYGSAKCWVPERYAALADHLIADFGADVIIFGAAPERDMAERIARAMRLKALNLVGATHIGDLPAPAGILRTVYRQRFRGHARGRRGGLAGRRHFRSDRCGRHAPGDAAVHAGARAGLLQSLFSAALPDRPSLHDAHFRRTGRGRGAGLAARPGWRRRAGIEERRSCLTRGACGQRYFSIATARFARKSAI